jgi:hypothetical protein
MTTSHLADGANRFVRFAASAPPNDIKAHDFRAKAGNDNRIARGSAPLPYARGVILAMDIDHDDAPIVTLHLLLPDGEIGVAFHTARHDDDVIALWRGLGRDFNLPLYIRDVAGKLDPVKPALGSESHARRIGSPLSLRRPRFLARRRSPLKDHALAQAQRLHLEKR